MSKILKEWTGERLITEVEDEVMHEHLHRYAVASDFVSGMTVLDVACGEGYGANLLARAGAAVIAVDIDEPTIRAATAKYKHPGLKFVCAPATSLPLADESIDIVTCFETIEHLDEQSELLGELKRVIRPSGLLFISTPDKHNYSDKPGFKNPYHKKELTITEFKDLIQTNFPFAQFYMQQSFAGSVLIPENSRELQNFYTGTFNNIVPEKDFQPKYWMAVASKQYVTFPAGSIFKDIHSVSHLRDQQTSRVHRTFTYRVGKVVLAPFKLLTGLFKK